LAIRAILAGASGVYLSGGFGVWELVYLVIGTARVSCATVVPVDRYRLADSWVLGYRASPLGQSYLAVHADSAFRCMIFDSLIARWFLAGAPSFLRHPHAAMRAGGA